jgi:hypothetical protein
MKNNIIEFIKSPNFNKKLGKSWYINANVNLKLIHIQGNLTNQITLNEVALICSILSPANSWFRNLEDTKNLLNWVFNYNLSEDKKPKFTTYGNNVLKAVKFLEDRKQFRFLNGHLNIYQVYDRFTSNWIENNMRALKTYNFYIHLRNPHYLNEAGKFFTIDRHMLKIAGLDKKSVTKKQYLELQSIYFEVFKELEFKCLFHEFQAILWANYVFINKGILHY